MRTPCLSWSKTTPFWMLKMNSPSLKKASRRKDPWAKTLRWKMQTTSHPNPNRNEGLELILKIANRHWSSRCSKRRVIKTRPIRHPRASWVQVAAWCLSRETTQPVKTSWWWKVVIVTKIIDNSRRLWFFKLTFINKMLMKEINIYYLYFFSGNHFFKKL